MTDWRESLWPVSSAPDDVSAAVLVLLSSAPDVVLLRKTEHLEHHAGQVAFPGGMREESDVSIDATAVREAHEEVGIDPNEIQVLGLLPGSHRTIAGTHVAVVIAEWSGESQLTCADEFEVSDVFRVPISQLAADNNRVTALIHGHPVGPGFQVAEHFIWGFTGQIIADLLRLTGWAEQWNEQRTRQVPASYMGSPGQIMGGGSHGKWG